MKQFIGIYDGTMTEEDLKQVLATKEQDGLMSKEDKIKLDSLTSGEGGSGTIESIEASKVVQDASHRFVSDTQISTWDSKAGTTTATGATDGLMSKEDKTKLDGIAESANKYTHPENHPATMITEDETHRFVTDAEKATWNTSSTKESIGLGNVTNDAQVKRSEMGVADGVATLDSTGKVPAAQLPSFVDDVTEYDNFEAFPETGESGKIYVDKATNKTYRWSGSAYVDIPASIALGETSSTAYAGDKGKANADEIAKIKDGTTVVPKATDASTVTGFTVGVNVPADAKFTDTVYTHPDNHPATMITEDETHRFVTDAEKNIWNAKADKIAATIEANGLMSAADKTKLDGIEAGANKYTHPTNHAATMITEDTDHKFVTDAQIAAWTAKASTDVATGEANGLMSKEDKAKLDGIAANANNYVHPDDESHRHVSDTQISTWDAKADATLATTDEDGLMSSGDKEKLDGIEAEANKYEHPDNHPATMITEDETHRFVTDTDKVAWTNKAEKTAATTEADGLMSSTDKTKLDGIAANANNYVHPDDTNTKHVSEAQIAAWTNKAEKTVVTGEANGLMSKEDKTKLDGIEEGANNYTHPQNHPATMITEDESHKFVTDAQIAEWTAKPADKEAIGLGNVTNDAQVKRSEMGVANGVATLDSTGKVPAAQLPSFVDDVLEVENYEALPETGESGKIYVTTDTNKTYRWTGAA